MACWALFLCLPAPNGYVGLQAAAQRACFNATTALKSPGRLALAAGHLWLKLPRAIGSAHRAHLIAAVDWFWTGFPNSIPASTHLVGPHASFTPNVVLGVGWRRRVLRCIHVARRLYHPRFLIFFWTFSCVRSGGAHCSICGVRAQCSRRIPQKSRVSVRYPFTAATGLRRTSPSRNARNNSPRTRLRAPRSQSLWVAWTRTRR